MKRRHCAGFDTAAETVAQNEIISSSQFFQKRKNITEVVTIICISHDHILSARRLNACRQRISISLRVNRDDAGPKGASDVWRTVRAAIVGDDYFAGDEIGRASCRGSGDAWGVWA